MNIGQPLEEMSTAEKLQALEEIWNSLSRTPSDIPSPTWHGRVLEDREEKVKKGTSEFTDWAEAKQNIRKDAE